MRTSILIALLPLAFSCRAIRVSDRHEKDLFLNVKNNILLNGTYNNSLDSSSSSDLFTLWQRLNNKDIKPFLNTYIELKVISNTKLSATFLSNHEIIENKILHGKYRKGYFVIKSRYKASLNFGPILWTMAGFKIYLGLTKENNLILLESNGGTTILLILPIFPAGDQHFLEYKRKTG